MQRCRGALLLSLITFAVAALAACGKKTSGAGTLPPKTPSPSPVYKTGDVDPEGDLVFWTIDASDHIEPFILSDTHGTLLLNGGGEEHPSPVYILACRSTHKILKTSDFTEFTRALSEVPAGTVVRRYDTCSVPRAHGLSEAQVMACQDAFPKAGLALNAEITSVCYCPNSNY